ncbi:isoaspartyl peptidase/L-asparaginase family protein [Flexithrix dorotheae]|uniref:isoaspartyl peptidase/L-asparaginase family protein n=1 Tax=Flexithrix dorotheae TaxID=70993 RepID=UPI000377D19D|nr:isoaspartyl peptidase/L-asparaginase [Flexithrix dorotheae]
MKNKTIFLILVLLLSWLSLFSQEKKDKITLVIHGGAGTILKKNMTPEKEKAYREKLDEALETGYKILNEGGTSLEAIVATIKVMEDSPLFNAGKGAVFANNGKNEMDASIMDGNTLNAGAVAGVTIIKNPITAALEVMENSEHVLLTREGAEAFATKQNLEIVEPSYFYTERRKKSLDRIKEAEDGRGSIQFSDYANRKHGTVGAVALDQYGNLAAGTSTGGMTNKKFARVGDSPIIGAGTYANNKTCAVSSTGHGEYFIRGVVAYDISAMMEYRGNSLEESANKVIMEKLTALGGTGGVISLDQEGNVAMPFNTAGMYRGFIKAGGKKAVFIYKDE